VETLHVVRMWAKFPMNPEIYESQFCCFRVQNAPISNSDLLDELETVTKIRPLPDMLFGESLLEVKSHAFSIRLNPKSALSGCLLVLNMENEELSSYAPSLLCQTTRNAVMCQMRVKHSQVWSSTMPNHAIQVLRQSHDWTYSTSFWGSIEFDSSRAIATERIGKECSQDMFPVHLLRNMELPIRWFREVVFWEDELGDNGLSKCSVKLRVMDGFFFILVVYELRVDGVLDSRRIETRIFHEFNSGKILREFRWYDNRIERMELRAQQVIEL
jgi:type 2A phosphatase activator TIP41